MTFPRTLPAARRAEDGGDPPSGPARALVAAAALLCAATALVHVGMVFLSVAPPNVVSERYRGPVDAWVSPYFDQDWRLFAPDPQSVREHVWARAAAGPPGGARRPGAWLDLTAQDVAAVRHDPFPSHTAQNMLRRAWTLYAAARAPGDGYDPERAGMFRRYLAGIARRRLAAHGERAAGAVQLRVVTTPVPPPGARTAPGSRVPSSTVDLPWWPADVR